MLTPVTKLDRRIEKLRVHLRTRRGRGDSAALMLLAKYLEQRDQRDWYRLSYVTGLLKVIYPHNSVYPIGVPLRDQGHPLLRLLKRA